MSVRRSARRKSCHSKSDNKIAMNVTELSSLIMEISKEKIDTPSTPATPIRKIDPNILKKHKRMYKEIISRYRGQLFDFNRMEEDVEELISITSKVNSVIQEHEPFSTTYVEIDVLEFKELQKFHHTLTRYIEAFQQKKRYASTMFNRQMLIEKHVLQESFEQEGKIEQFLLLTFQRMELAKHQLNQEIMTRMMLEMKMEEQIQLLNEEILLEHQARCELNHRLERAAQFKKFITDNLELLKDCIQSLIEKYEQAAAIAAEKGRAEAKFQEPSRTYETLNILKGLDKIDDVVRELRTLVDFTDEEETVRPNLRLRKLDQLTNHLANEISKRRIVEHNNEDLEGKIKELENRLIDERNKRTQLMTSHAFAP